MASNNVDSIIIIGGGLVGSLCAIFMARKGYHVTVFEYREDIRTEKLQKGRSINMSLSSRGKMALNAVGLENMILKSAVAMKGRLLHDVKGKTKSVPYGARTEECIYSINRNFLNTLLLTELFNYPNVKIHFSHKLIRVNFDEESITVLNTKTEEVKVHFANLIIGADGAFSTLRRHMQQLPLFELTQTYIKHGYLELHISAKHGTKMIPNHLHIWPRNQFMLIALPNQDNSWTVTLFMPFENFNLLKNEEQVLDFFQTTFPDIVPLIEEKNLVDDFLRTKPSPLVSIKCNPYHVGTKFLILGDAAHAMVPFYGQGMNAGFEDCFILDKILTKNFGNIRMSIEEFSNVRTEDAFAICDLAMYNYVEMRTLVMQPSYHLRKKFDEILFRLFPKLWIPLYTSVTFSTMGYKECAQNREWQNKVINSLVKFMTYIFVLFVAYYFFS